MKEFQNFLRRTDYMARDMKESGIDIVGFIPQNWITARLKYLSNIKTGSQDTQDAVEGGLYPFYVRSPIVERIDKYVFDGEAILMAGDGVGAGKIFHYVNGKFGCHQRVYILNSFKRITGKFLFYYLKNLFSVEIEKGSAKSTVDSVRLPMLQNFIICIPLLQEQKRITDYLDKKCKEIDALSSDIQFQISILENYKRSVIFDSLVKGLSGEKLKVTDSDVWKAIPKSWELKDIKYVFEIVKRIAGKEGYDILSVTQKGLKVKDISNNEGQIAESYSGYQFVYPTDYVMNHMDLLTGWVDCSTMFGVTSPDYRVFRLQDKKNNNLDYFKYLMQCCYMNRIFYSLGQGVSNLGRWRLQTSTFMNFKIPVPPLEEQNQIAEYLGRKSDEIDGVISEKQKQLEILEQYKKSLIYEYVTGKKEVL